MSKSYLISYKRLLRTQVPKVHNDSKNALKKLPATAKSGVIIKPVTFPVVTGISYSLTYGKLCGKSCNKADASARERLSLRCPLILGQNVRIECQHVCS